MIATGGTVGLAERIIDGTHDMTCVLYFRDVREFKSRVDSYSREMLRKEAQIKDLQARLENGEGSKRIYLIIILQGRRNIVGYLFPKLCTPAHNVILHLSCVF